MTGNMKAHMLLAACFSILIIDLIIFTILIIFIILITMNTFITYLVGVFLWVSVLRGEKKQSQGKYETKKSFECLGSQLDAILCL